MDREKMVEAGKATGDRSKSRENVAESSKVLQQSDNGTAETEE